MNCPEFEACLLDLAAERSREDLRCAEALSHARVCSRCEARLAEEAALLAGLSALADSVRQETAPSHTEEALLTRFRELERGKTATPAAVTDGGTHKPGSWRIPFYAALAASVLLMIGWALTQHTREAALHEAQVQPAPKPVTGSEDKAATPIKVMPERSSEPVRKPIRPTRTRPARISPSSTGGPIEYAARRPVRTEKPRHQAESVGDDRIETEFFPFMATGPQLPSEQRQFVRVKLPRSALQVFGLPMNMERALEPVQADVMLAEDGRALAVRFVRD